MARRGPWIGFAKQLHSAWLEIKNQYFPKNFKELLDQPGLKIAVSNIERNPKNPDNCDILYIGAEERHLFNLIIYEWLEVRNRTLMIEFTDKYDICVQLNTTKQPLYTPDVLAQYLVQKIHLKVPRYLLACEDDWENLQLKTDNLNNSYNITLLFNVKLKGVNFIMLPFLFRHSGQNNELGSVESTHAQLDALCKWVQPKLKHKRSLSEIREDYEALIRHIEDEIMRRSKHWEEWKAARVRLI